jgi:acetyl-CoA carboxylase carboxyl transferase subunit beta
MSWLQKLLPPKIKSRTTPNKSAVPEGLWSKCSACSAVLYRSDLESNLEVCPKCGFHNAVPARERLNQKTNPLTSITK